MVQFRKLAIFPNGELKSVGTDNLHHMRRKLIDRKRKTKTIIPNILVVCEGEKTEPNYFECFKLRTKDVIKLEIDGEGKNTESLVKETVKIRKKIEKQKDILFDQVWCVFDRDSFPPDQFNNAIAIANKHKFGVAYTNEAFELWYLLHFNLYTTSMTRKTLVKKLDEIMQDKYKVRYKKNCTNMYEIIKDRQAFAITNSQKLIEMHNNISELNPEKNNPCTTVQNLVIELNKYIK